MAIKFGKWLHAIVGIAPGRDHVVPLVAYTGYGSFVTARGKLFHAKTNVTLGHAKPRALSGIVCHKACYDIVAHHTTFDLSYKALWHIMCNKPGT